MKKQTKPNKKITIKQDAICSKHRRKGCAHMFKRSPFSGAGNIFSSEIDPFEDHNEDKLGMIMCKCSCHPKNKKSNMLTPDLCEHCQGKSISVKRWFEFWKI